MRGSHLLTTLTVSETACICRVTLLIPRAPSNFGPMYITLLFYQCEVHHLSVLSPLQEPRTYLKWRLAVTQIRQYIYIDIESVVKKASKAKVRIYTYNTSSDIYTKAVSKAMLMLALLYPKRTMPILRPW